MQQVQTHTYATKRVCLIGDAAHGQLPFQGCASPGVAMEEALVLSRLLGRAGAASGVAAALAAYDAACRPRAERAIRASFDLGHLLTGRAPGVGLGDPLELAKALRQCTDILEDIDAEAHCREAERLMDAHLAMMRQW